MEHPPTYNIVGHDWQTAPPNGIDFTDQDAEQLLRHSDGIYLPPGWIHPEATTLLNTTSMTLMHAYKLSHARRQQLFADWWRSLPCLN